MPVLQFGGSIIDRNWTFIHLFLGLLHDGLQISLAFYATMALRPGSSANKNLSYIEEVEIFILFLFLSWFDL